MTYDIGNLGPGFGQAKYGRVKPINRIQIPHHDILAGIFDSDHVIFFLLIWSLVGSIQRLYIYICWFFAKQAELRRKGRDC